MKMLKPNKHYQNLKDSYLFYNIAQKTMLIKRHIQTRKCCAWGLEM